jgi:hypothetical protein
MQLEAGARVKSFDRTGAIITAFPDGKSIAAHAHFPHSEELGSKHFDRTPLSRYHSDMTSPLKWQLALTGVAVAGISGWIVAWRVSQERDNLAAGLQSNVRTIAQSRSGKPSSPKADTSAGLVKLIKDKRTAAFLERLPDILAAAKPGVRNERYLQAARDVLLDNNWERRTLNFALLMEHLRPEDALAMHEVMLALHREGRPLEEYRNFAVRWGEVDGKGAMEYYKTDPNSKIMAWDVQQIMKGWGQTAPLEALQWLGKNHDLAKDPAPANGVLLGWSLREPEAATAWLFANATSQSMAARGVSDIMLAQLYGKGVQGAGEWLASLPDNEEANAASSAGWMAIQRRFDRLSIEDAGALWKSVGNQSWMGWNEFEAFSRTIATANGGSDAGFLTAAASGDAAGNISQKFEHWAATEPERTSTWLTQHPEASPFRTAAIQGLVRYLETTDPEAAAEWRKQLQ